MIQSVVEYLNDQLLAYEYYTEQHGLVEIIQQGDKTFPAKYCGKGKYKDISTFNRKAGACYFRMNGTVASTVSEDGLVSCKHMVQFTIPLRFVSVIPRDRLTSDNQYSDHELALELTRIFATKVTTLKATLKAKSVDVETTGWNSNANEVFNSEYVVIGNDQLNTKYSYLYLDMIVTVLIRRECIDDYCTAISSCDVLLASLSNDQLLTCILPSYDFSDTNVQDNTTAQQQTDMSDWLCTNDITTELIYNASSTDEIEDTSVNANYAGTYTTENLTNVATVQYEVDTGGGYNVVTLPFTLTAGDQFKVTITRTVPATESTVELTGTY